MSGFFDENNFLHAALLKAWDIIITNLMFVLCCIPIVTIGPALTALYHSTLRMVKGTNTGAVKTFFRAFKENFKQSLIVWLGTLVIAFVIYANHIMLSAQNNSLAHVLFYLTIFAALGVIALNLYIYPVIAAFDGSLNMLLKNAFIFTVIHFFKTFIMCILWGLPLLMTFVDVQLQPLYVFCWFFFLFALLAYICSFFFYKMFRPYLLSETETEIDKKHY